MTTKREARVHSTGTILSVHYGTSIILEYLPDESEDGESIELELPASLARAYTPEELQAGRSIKITYR